VQIAGAKNAKNAFLGRGRARAADVRCHPFLAMSVGDDAFLLALAGLVAADDVDMVRCLRFPVLEARRLISRDTHM
jgi:hypothetical protein